MTPGKAIAWFFACFVVGSTIGGVLAVTSHKPIAGKLERMTYLPDMHVAAHNTKLVRCMTYLPDMKDSELKRW